MTPWWSGRRPPPRPSRRCSGPTTAGRRLPACSDAPWSAWAPTRPQARRASSVRVLRQALGFTVSVIVAATGDFALLEEMAASGDPDLVWVARENLKKARLRRWPARLDHVRALLAT